MDTPRRAADDLLDVVRALLLLQGALLVATTIEALIFSAVFPAVGGPVVMSGAVAVMIIVSRARLSAGRRWPRRLIYAIEGLNLAFFGVDIALALALTHALPPVVAILTQLVLPVSVIVILRRSARAAMATIPSGVLAAFGGLS